MIQFREQGVPTEGVESNEILLTMTARDPSVPANQSQSQNLSDLSPVPHWNRHQLISIDYSNIQRPEDAVSVVQADPNADTAHSPLDLLVAHPLPIGTSPFLLPGVVRPCLSMQERLPPLLEGNGATFSVVNIKNSRMLFNSQAAQLLHPHFDTFSEKRRRIILRSSDYESVRQSLRLIQAAALRVDIARNGRSVHKPVSKHAGLIEGPGYRPERTLDLLLTFTQRRTLEFSRMLPAPPSLIVLRPVYSAARPSHQLVASHSQPHLIADNEHALDRDGLRLKASSISGTVNIVQMSCVLLGIDPIPTALVHDGLTTDSQADRAARSDIPRKLSLALEDRKRKIAEVLRSLPLP